MLKCSVLPPNNGMYAYNVLKKRAEDGGGKRTKYCFPVFAIRLFNHLPEEIRTLPIKNFKAGTKELLVIPLYSVSEFFVDP